MNKGITKSTFREIRSSFGRYMAIFLIVALGVGFFPVLKLHMMRWYIPQTVILQI